MSWSLKYNNIELSTYGLTVASSGPSLATLLTSDIMQLQDRAYAPDARAPSKPLNFGIVVRATTTAQLFSYLSDIKRVCAQRTAGQLILGIQDDRYYTARFERFMGRRVSPLVFEGELNFIADDPLAYANSETTEGPTNVDADPDTIPLDVGGSAYVKPEFTLIAGEALAAITLLVENTDTGEEFTWTGTIGNGKSFVIDSALWYATNDGSSAMSGINTGGQFPRLIPGTTNHIKVTAFSTTGTLTIVYRTAYL